LNIEALVDVQSAQVGSRSLLSSIFDICCTMMCFGRNKHTLKWTPYQQATSTV